MKTVKIALEDQILADLIEDQLSHVDHIRTGDAADLVIARINTQDDVPHLILGKADDSPNSLPLPLRLGDLVDRVRYLLSGRDRFADQGEIAFGDFILNAQDGTMKDKTGDRKARLTDKEKLIILVLHDAPGKTLNRQKLLQEVWSYAETVETHTLETHLYRLRQKLEETFGASGLIVTKDGFYTLQTD